VTKSAHRKAVFPTFLDHDSEFEKDDDEDNYNENNNNYDNDNVRTEKSYRSEAVFTEFMHKLFPGHAIFSKKTSALFIIAVNHDYLKMFGGSTMTHSRTVRFIELVSVVLVSLFVDTVFFGVFYSPASCTQYDTKVNTTIYRCNCHSFYIISHLPSLPPFLLHSLPPCYLPSILLSASLTLPASYPPSSPHVLIFLHFCLHLTLSSFFFLTLLLPSSAVLPI
jgi:hypothetical protein